MSLHRALLVAFATLMTTGAASVAFAGCGGCGGGFAVTYPAPPVAYGAPVGYGAPPAYEPPVGYGAPPAYGPPVGYGGPPAYEQPFANQPGFAPVMVAPAPIGVGGWDTNGCGCGRSVVYAPYAPPVGPAPVYIVNQGPVYNGPAFMTAYRTYSPAAALAPAINYPYIAHRYHPHPVYYGARVVYRDRIIYRPVFVHARPRPVWHPN